MKKLRIAYFIDEYRPGAGTENQLKGILQNINPEQVEARLFTLRKKIPEEYRKDIPCPTECLHVGKLFSFDGFVKFFKLIRKLRKEKFDIVMIYFVDTNLFVVPACYLAGVKSCVVNRRDLGYWYNRKILRILNIINKKTDYFLVNSEAVKKAVVENEHFPGDRIKVIYNALWDEPMSDKRKISRESPGIPADTKIIGIIANLRPVKRIDRFLLMAKAVNEKLSSTHFLILGGGELDKELKRQAENIGLKNSVHFMGPVSDVQSYLEIFDVGVLTSESEGLSNTLIEYARAGVPTVAFDVGGNGEVIKNEKSGVLIPDGDVNQFVAAVICILTDNELQERYAGSGRQVVDELFSPKKILHQTMEFYRAITANNEKV